MDLRKRDLRNEKNANVIKGHITPFSNKTEKSSVNANNDLGFNNLKDCFTSISKKSDK